MAIKAIDMGMVLTPGSLCGEMIITLALKVRYNGSTPTLSVILPMFITFMTLIAMNIILNKLCTDSLLNDIAHDLYYITVTIK